MTKFSEAVSQRLGGQQKFYNAYSGLPTHIHNYLKMLEFASSLQLKIFAKPFAKTKIFAKTFAKPKIFAKPFAKTKIFAKTFVKLKVFAKPFAKM
jgi:hypothetical protein